MRRTMIALAIVLLGVVGVDAVGAQPPCEPTCELPATSASFAVAELVALAPAAIAVTVLAVRRRGDAGR